MPRAASSTIAHTAVTDHRVPRTPQPAKAGPGAIDPNTPLLVPFGTGAHPPAGPERERDLGVALARLGRKVPAAGARTFQTVVGPQIERRLDAALALWPGDHDAWMAKAQLGMARGDDAAVLAAARVAAGVAPDSEQALAVVAESAVNFDPDLAIRTAGRLIAWNPSVVQYRTLRAQAYMQKQDWAAAAADCRAALEIFPLNPDARALLAACLHRQGDTAGGRREIAAAAGLASDPRAKARMRKWYDDLTR
jgi:tetratricopeptide (TPR) repeat protein